MSPFLLMLSWWCFVSVCVCVWLHKREKIHFDYDVPFPQMTSNSPGENAASRSRRSSTMVRMDGIVVGDTDRVVVATLMRRIAV